MVSSLSGISSELPEAEQYVRDNADQPSEFWDDPLAFPPPCQPEPENEKGDHEHASKCEVAREQLRRALAVHAPHVLLVADPPAATTDTA